MTKRDLKWHPYKMHVWKEKKIIKKVDLLKEIQDLIKIVTAGIRRRKQVSLQRNEGLMNMNI